MVDPTDLDDEVRINQLINQSYKIQVNIII